MTTARGGWSKFIWDCYVDGKRYTLFRETGADISNSKMRWWKKYIEENKITPLEPCTMFKITRDNKLVGAK